MFDCSYQSLQLLFHLPTHPLTLQFCENLPVLPKPQSLHSGRTNVYLYFHQYLIMDKSESCHQYLAELLLLVFF